jgi:hypothetical protein
MVFVISCTVRVNINPLSGNAPRCTLLYYFTLSNGRLFYSVYRQTISLIRGSVGESAATQWVNMWIYWPKHTDIIMFS